MGSANLDSVDSVVEAVRAGTSAALVVRGASTTDWPTAFRVMHVSGAESDADLRGAGVHQLCVQLLDQVPRLSPAQHDILRSAFDPAGPEPDPNAVGLTVFSLLATAAEAAPVVCLIQCAEWLDELSRRALAITARRLMTESVTLLFVVQGGAVPQELAGLPELLAGLDRQVDAVTAG